MRIFVTGGSGFVGSAVVPELRRAGHQVVALARSDASASAAKIAGAEVQRGDLADLDVLTRGASSADGVIHLGFIHDFANYAKSAETDRAAIHAMAAALAGSNRPLVVTSGTLGAGAQGTIGTEDDPGDATRRFSESALDAASPGLRGVVVRLSPTVHGDGDHGFVPRLIQIAREKGISGYPGEGTNRWSAVHRLDAATLFRLAIETAPGGPCNRSRGSAWWSTSAGLDRFSRSISPRRVRRRATWCAGRRRRSASFKTSNRGLISTDS
jgi:nucleoside-diphosphate-sugar epimerase